jgi:NADH-quinone oxidoreductase subunit N
MTLNALLTLLPFLVLFIGSVAVLFVSERRALRFGVFCALIAAGFAWWPCAASVSDTPLVSSGPFARGCLTVWALLGAATCLLAERYRASRRFASPEFAGLVLFCVLGMSILSASTSLVSLFLGLEAMTLAFYVLIAFDRDNPTGAEAGLKYLLPGFLASALLAFGIAIVYAATGTFALHGSVTFAGGDASMHAIAMLGWTLIICAMAFKASLAPFHLWTPDVYQGAPAPVAGLLASGSKGAVFAVLLASIPLALIAPLRPLLAGLAALSMLAGTFAALPQTNLKRMLAYSSVVHMGYMVLALLTGQRAGLEAGMFYLLSYGAATVAAFGLLASLSDSSGEPQNYAALEGLAGKSPWRAALLTILLLSLAGFPPLAGFMGKLVLFSSALDAGYVWLVALALFSSLVSCYYYLRPIVRLFRCGPIAANSVAANGGERVVLWLCAIIIVTAGIYPGPFFQMISAIAP